MQKKPSAIRSAVSIEHRLVTDADRQTQGHSFYMRDAMLASKSYRILTVKEGQTLDKVVCVDRSKVRSSVSNLVKNKSYSLTQFTDSIHQKNMPF